MPTTYTVPDNPADPEAAALEVIVRMPALVLHTDLCGLIRKESEYCESMLWS
jgi:hypothetical protein